MWLIDIQHKKEYKDLNIFDFLELILLKIILGKIQRRIKMKPKLSK